MLYNVGIQNVSNADFTLFSTAIVATTANMRGKQGTRPVVSFTKHNALRQTYSKNKTFYNYEFAINLMLKKYMETIYVVVIKLRNTKTCFVRNLFQS